MIAKIFHSENTNLLQLSKKSPSIVHFVRKLIFCTRSSILIALIDLETRSFSINIKWQSDAMTAAGGNDIGSKLNQLNLPWNIDFDEDKTIYIADRFNHRVIAWDKDATSGRVVAGGNGRGNRNNQLNEPMKVIVDTLNDCLIIADYGNKRIVRWPRRNGTTHGETILNNIQCSNVILYRNMYLYVSDEINHDIKRFEIDGSQGVVVAGGNGPGNKLNQCSNPQFIHIDGDETVYVSDRRNHRVMKWLKGAKEGIIVAGEQGQGNSLKQLSRPSGIFVDKLGTLYVADAGNHRIIRWLKNAKEGRIIAGGNGYGTQANQFNDPINFSFDDDDNIYVVDSENNRIQKFLLDNNC